MDTKNKKSFLSLWCRAQSRRVRAAQQPTAAQQSSQRPAEQRPARRRSKHFNIAQQYLSVLLSINKFWICQFQIGAIHQIQIYPLSSTEALYIILLFCVSYAKYAASGKTS